MSNEELEQEELESVDDAEELAVAADADDDIEENMDELPVATKKSKVSVEEETEPHTIEAKQRERDALAKAMEAFFAKGGKVQEIAPNVVADPPKKPESKYGSRPI